MNPTLVLMLMSTMLAMAMMPMSMMRHAIQRTSPRFKKRG